LKGGFQFSKYLKVKIIAKKESLMERGGIAEILFGQDDCVSATRSVGTFYGGKERGLSEGRNPCRFPGKKSFGVTVNEVLPFFLLVVSGDSKRPHV